MSEIKCKCSVNNILGCEKVTEPEWKKQIQQNDDLFLSDFDKVDTIVKDLIDIKQNYPTYIEEDNAIDYAIECIYKIQELKQQENASIQALNKTIENHYKMEEEL